PIPWARPRSGARGIPSHARPAARLLGLGPPRRGGARRGAAADPAAGPRRPAGPAPSRLPPRGPHASARHGAGGLMARVLTIGAAQLGPIARSESRGD